MYLTGLLRSASDSAIDSALLVPLVLNPTSCRTTTQAQAPAVACRGRRYAVIQHAASSVLDAEVLYWLRRYLDAASCGKLQCVCKSLQELLTAHDEVWERLLDEHLGLSTPTLPGWTQAESSR